MAVDAVVDVAMGVGVGVAVSKGGLLGLCEVVGVVEVVLGAEVVDSVV